MLWPCLVSPKTDDEIEAGKAAAVAGQLVIGATTTKVEKEHALLIMPGNIQVPLPNQDIPTIVSNVSLLLRSHAPPSPPLFAGRS